MTGQPQATWTIVKDFSGDRFENCALSLFDLMRDRLQRGERSITGVSFVNCRIEGPAVMLVTGGCNFDAVNFGYAGGDIAALVLRPASATKVVGVIPVVNCTFQNVEFFSVGFTGPDPFLEQILALKNQLQ